VSSLPAGTAAKTNQAVKPGVPANLIAEGGPQRITLRWDAPMDPHGAPVTGYRIERSDADETETTDDFTRLHSNTGSDATTYVDSTVGANKTLYYRVYAINSIDTGDASNVAKGTSTAGDGSAIVAKPEGLLAGHTAADDSITSDDIALRDRPGQIAIEWTAVTGADYYRVEWSPDGQDGNWRPLTGNTKTAPDSEDATPYQRTGATSGIHKGLTGNTTYYYQVFAVKGTSSSNPSETATSKTTMAEVPAAPTEFAAAASGTQINLAWKAPKDPAGAPVTGYRIDRMKKGDDWVTVTNSLGDVTSYSDANLEASTEYSYRIYAKNSGVYNSDTTDTPRAMSPHPGRSVASDPATTTTGTGPVTTTLTAPTNVDATSNAAGQVTVTWDDGTGATMGHWVVLITDDFEEFVVADSAQTDGDYTFTGLTSGTVYRAYVFAVQSDDDFEAGADTDTVTVQ
jgi:hypothetical protein